MALESDLFSQLLSHCVADELSERLPGATQNECRASRVPIQLETLRMRRNPDLAHRRIRAHHKLARRLLELNGQRTGVEINLELVVLGSRRELAVKIVQRLFGAHLKFLFVHGVSTVRFRR